VSDLTSDPVVIKAIAALWSSEIAYAGDLGVPKVAGQGLKQIQSPESGPTPKPGRRSRSGD
jgi:hypothetical protein